jgi:hypothetical protein
VPKALAAIAALLFAAAAPAAHTQRAALRLVSARPLAVRGVAFRSDERVRVVVRIEKRTWQKTAQTSASGLFRASFPSVPFDPCNADFSITARGTRGDHAALKLPPRECPPA